MGTDNTSRWGNLGKTLAIGGASGIALTLLPPLSVYADVQPPWHQLPENTALTLLLDTTDGTWSQLNQYQLFKLLDEQLGYAPSLPGLPYLPYGIDVATEVAPWVSDTVVVALLPVQPGDRGTTADHTVMLAPIADAESFAAFRDSLLAQQSGDPELIPSLGTEIYYWPAPEPAPWPEPWPEDDALEEPMCDLAAPDLACDEENGSESPTEETPEELGPEALESNATLRLRGAIGLPLTVTPFHEGDEPATEMEVEVPVPLVGFGQAGLAVAFLPDTLVTAESPAAIEQYLRLRQEQTSTLADSREFQRTLTHRQQTQALFAVYGNALELLNYDLSAEAFDLADLPLPVPLPAPPSLDDDTLQTLRSLNFGGTLEALVYPLPAGLQFRGRYYYDAVPFNFAITPEVPNADSPLTLLPASTFLMMSGRNVAGLWRNVSTILENASDFTSEGLATIRSFFTLSTGLDLDRDLFGWMDGEVAIAAFPTAGGPLQYAGLGLLLQTSDRPTAENTLATLDELLPGFGLTAYPRTVNQQPATSWELRFSRTDDDYRPELSVGSHSWVAEDMLALTSGTVPMASLLAPSPHDPLADFFLFDQATAAFPRPNNGYFYLNAGATLALVYQVFDLHDDPAFAATKPFLGSIRSLSATTAQTPNYIEAQGQLGLAPHRE
ncbi:DUF3352 domain-containing protein [Nodosilinea sp. LEGE 07088]|uniref:DUF3352 domain-containing protein n=1 Tax=Nodosilinea sp. LEGE 07088 TaxID=2777968 RepID=UPI001881252D|nr:DUF3352 domain-containing protein [Nodosilinea sp. LEGE 07088]MBE9137136.1 DUF3352 domain-containing protein [Nodosilinea sp. LEGE 07088]